MFLVAIVVIAAIVALRPQFEYLKVEINKGVLSNTPTITDYGNPVYLPQGSYFQYPTMVKYEKCEVVETGSYYLRAGTTYEDPSAIQITKGKSSYEICNNLRGTSIEVVYALYREDQ